VRLSYAGCTPGGLYSGVENRQGLWEKINYWGQRLVRGCSQRKLGVPRIMGGRCGGATKLRPLNAHGGLNQKESGIECLRGCVT